MVEVESSEIVKMVREIMLKRGCKVVIKISIKGWFRMMSKLPGQLLELP